MLLIRPASDDATQNPIELFEPEPGDEHFTLAALQKAVEGYIELVALPTCPELVLVVNEEGLPRGLPANLAASAIAGRRLVGPVVIARRTAIR